jgi:DNA replication protein DnaC
VPVSTIEEILARRVPGRDPSRPAPRRGAAVLSPQAEAELWRERALRRHERLAPEAFTDARLGADAPRQAREWVDSYVAGSLGDRCSLMLSGRVGRGKTHLAYGALRAIAEAGCRDAAWAGGTVAQIFTRLRPNSGEHRAAVIRELTTIPILLLDDLGAVKDSEWTEEAILDLIDARISRLAPMIVTTNATPKELRAAIGDRALSRLAGMCRQFEFPANTPDRRLP